MTKKLLCLNVELLKAFDSSKRNYSFHVPFPALCSTFISTSLIDAIDTAQRLIDEHDLVEIVSQTTEVNWFSSLDQKIYQTINSALHVTKSSLYFSGAFAPQKEPVFVSKRLPLSCIEPTGITVTKELNLSLLKTDTAKTLIVEIENLDREMRLAWERQDSLETLDSALEELSTTSIIVNSDKTDLLAHEVGTEIKQLMKEAERLELTIEKKCEILCKRVLDLAVGDQIVTQLDYQNKSQEIRIESVRYYDGVLCLNGSKMLKNGASGKRTESAYIVLVPKDER